MGTLQFQDLLSEFYVAGSDLATLAHPLAQERDVTHPTTKSKNASESIVRILECHLAGTAVMAGTGAAQNIPVFLEYHEAEDGARFFVATRASRPVFKCDVTHEREQLELPLKVLAQKGLEAQVRARNLELRLQNRERDAQARRKKRRTGSAGTFASTRIQRRYRDLDCSDVLLSVANNGQWRLDFHISLRYRADSANVFAPETNALLDVLFSCKSRSHFLKHEITNLRSKMDISYNIQRKFNHQSARFTKELQLDIGDAAAALEIPQLNVQLLPFQKESLFWMLTKEGFPPTAACPPPEDLASLLESLNANISFGYEIMELPGDTIIFWNKFTGYILPLQDAQELTNSLPKRAKGVLSEEMGLGKTLEILALMLVHKRTINGAPTFLSDSKKTILKTATNLIVCPDSILQQWIDEVEAHVVSEASHRSMNIFHYKGYQEVKKHFDTEDIAAIVSHLSTYDIILCSYATVSSEVHYAEFNSSARQRRGTAPKYDYTSPLSLLEFFRIILDEVQMLGSESTNAARCTGLLHRVHTWGVSGTPIYDIHHFQTVLSYLQFHPFQDYPKIVDAVENDTYRQNSLLSARASNKLAHLVNGVRFDIMDLMDVFPRFNLCIRHSKNDVADQIRIPKQHNYIVPLEFLPIEHDNYMNLWNAFLSTSGFQEDGQGTSDMPAAQLNYWLGLLRGTCCHALMPTTSQRQENDSELPEVQSIDAILKKITDEVLDKIDNLHRENLGLKIQAAQVDMELNHEAMKAVNNLDLIREELINDLKIKFGIQISFDTPNKVLDYDADNEFQKGRAKPYLDLLHQCFFFTATAYYLQGSKKLEIVDENNEKQAHIISLRTEKQGSECHFSAKKYTDVYSEEEMKQISEFQTQEQDNYGFAEILRQSILADRIEQVDSEISSMKEYLSRPSSKCTCHLEEVPFRWEKDYSSNMHVANCFKRLQTFFQNLNNQAQHFNMLVEKLKEYSFKPIIKDYDEGNQDEKAQDYENSIEDQDKIFALLDCLERILSNREEIVTADEEMNMDKKSSIKGAETLSPFHINLVMDLSLLEGPSLKLVFTDLKNLSIVKSFSGSVSKDVNSFENYLLGFEKETLRIKKETKQVRENLKMFNEIYNAKTAYFSNLQRISDSLVSLIQLKPASKAAILKNTKDNTLIGKNTQKIHNLQSRLKYLETLTRLKENLNREHKFSCTICLGEIYMGSVIKCGHYFCQDCICSWLKNHSSCPLCKMQTTLSGVYSFKFQDLQPDKEKDKDEKEDANREEGASKEHQLGSGITDVDYPSKYSRYPDLDKIHQLTLKESYGSKVDFAVKLILYLLYRHRDGQDGAIVERAPQIIIYSQYSEFLGLLSKVLKQHSIQHCNTAGSGKFSKIVEKFKKNPEVTCLLLNVTRQATGLTLVNATHVFIMDPIMNTSDELQAINRTHRIGQTRETYVWNFVVRNTVEQNIVRLKGVLEERIASRQRQKTQPSKAIPMKKEELAVQKGIDAEDVDYEESEDEYLFNVNQGGSVSDKHIWNCFFQD